MADPSFAKDLSKELRGMNDTLNDLEQELRDMADHFQARMNKRHALKKRLGKVIQEVEELATTPSNLSDDQPDKDTV